MTADNVIRLRDYKTKDERGPDLVAPCVWITKEEALKRWPVADTSPCEYVAPDGDCA